MDVQRCGITEFCWSIVSAIAKGAAECISRAEASAGTPVLWGAAAVAAFSSPLGEEQLLPAATASAEACIVRIVDTTINAVHPAPPY